MAFQNNGIEYNIETTSKKYEIKSHGSIEFPCAGYGTAVNKYKDVPWHWHEELEMIYAKEGEFVVYVPNKSFHLKKGEAIFINSNILHAVNTENYGVGYSFVFHKNILSGTESGIFDKKFIQPLINSKIKAVSFTKNIEWEKTIIENMKEILKFLKEENMGFELLVREKISHIWYLLYINLKVFSENYKTFDDIDTVRLKRMLEFIHENYNEQLKLADISSVVNIGERECLRCFQRTIKISPIQYLMKYRIAKGADLLKSSDFSIAEIATQCGFESPSNFSKHFKKFYNFSPKEYKNKKY